MQGRVTCRFYLLLAACLWLAACQSTPPATPTIVEVPVIVTRIVPQAINRETENVPAQLEAQAIAARATPTTHCAPTAPETSVVVTIGAILPLSSPGALLAGFAMQTAINLAVNDINEQGGVNGTPLRLITYDSSGTAERAAQFAERLILLDCAVAIVGLYHNAEAMAVADVAHRYGVPVIVAAAGADDITARGYPEVFRLAPSYSMLTQIPAAWLTAVGDYNGDGTLSATVISDNTSNATAIVEAIVAHMHDSSIEADNLRVDLPSTDFSSAIARLVARETLPDAIYIAVKGQPALRLHAQLLEAGIGPSRATLIVQAHEGLDADQFWAEVPNGTGTVVMRTGPWVGTITERGQDFAIKYDQYLGRWPESYAFAAYDAVTIVASALANAPSWHSNDIIAALEQTDKPVTGGNLTFANTSQVSASGDLPGYAWHQWLDSPILYLQYTEPNQPATAMTIVWPPHYGPTSQ